MKKNSVCVSKKFLLFFLLGFIISMIVYLSYVLSNNKSTTKTQAKELKIIGGEDAEEGEFPFNVALFSNGSFGFNRQNGMFYYDFLPFCTGVLINDQYVLTAAHCIKGYPYIKLAINLTKRKGEINPSKYFKHFYKAKNIIFHPNYVPLQIRIFNQDYNDIALIKLDHIVTEFNNALLPSEKDIYKINNSLESTLFGWGLLSEHSEEPTFVLQKMNFSLDYSQLRSKRTLNSNMFQYSRNMANHDSGAPLLYQRGSDYVVLGIANTVDYNLGNAQFANVFLEKDWITDTIGCMFNNAKEACRGNCYWDECNSMCLFGKYPKKNNRSSYEKCQCKDFTNPISCKSFIGENNSNTSCTFHGDCNLCTNTDEILDENCQIKKN